ncbi:dorsalin-1 [Trichonephila clavipes]|uniref:Dorsalin-1 n=1 Tax=Trichonephila clavipes TaxID=2585209 RepID=A0A8X6REF2_TRICX|nr:dorsalin-1 [Trichonephila clavipes]
MDAKMVDSKRVETYSVLGDTADLLKSKQFNPNKELFSLNVTKAFQRALENEAKQLHLAISIPEAFVELLILDDGTPEGPQLLVLSETVEKQANGEDHILARMRRSMQEKVPEFPEIAESQESGNKNYVCYSL